MASGSIFDNDLLFTQHKHSGCMANKGLMAAHKQQNDCERGKRLHLTHLVVRHSTNQRTVSYCLILPLLETITLFSYAEKSKVVR